MKQDFGSSSTAGLVRLSDVEWEERVKRIKQAQERYPDLDLGQIGDGVALDYQQNKVSKPATTLRDRVRNWFDPKP